MPRSKLVMVAIGVAAWTSVAQAAAVIEITALTPENGIGGYLPGTTVDFEVSITTDAPIQARLLTLDFSASSPELMLAGPDDYPLDAVGQPMGNGLEEFVFDFGTVQPAIYSQFPDYPLANVTYNAAFPISGFMLEFPAGVPVVVGHGTVILPMMLGYFFCIDAVNAGADSNNMGARIDFDFGSPTTWHSNPDFGADVIVGEPLYIPEPGTLVLLVAGSLVSLAHRRARS